MIRFLAALLFALIPGPALAQDNPSVDPAQAELGKVQKWRTADGLPYEYYVPKEYDAEEGINLTVVLHGNGLNHRWTFWNHPAGEFRKDDIVVSPDGTGEAGGNPEFLGTKECADRLHALLEEVKAVWKINQVFLYGHSQGSFFVFYYAGLFPEDVDGVCGHASGKWPGTRLGKFGHHQAIGILHGTDDHIPYWQGFDARTDYEDANYPNVHLRTLFDWPHRPNYFQAENVLSWCEGMTSEDPARVEACLDYLCDPKMPMGADWSAIFDVGTRLSEMKEATVKQKGVGSKAAKAADELCAKHVKAVEKGLGKKGKVSQLSKGDWSGRLIRLVEDFHGVDSLVAFQKKHKKHFDGLEKGADRALKVWWAKKEKDPKEAFDAGLDLLESGFLNYQLPEIHQTLTTWAQAAKTHGLGKKSLQRWEELGELYTLAREEGFKEFVKENEKAKL